MAKVFKFARDVSPEEWNTLPRAFKAGETVLEFRGYDYGCVRDDAMYGGFETIACCLDPDGPFFTVPVHMLRDESGARPTGEYTFSVTKRTT